MFVTRARRALDSGPMVNTELRLRAVRTPITLRACIRATLRERSVCVLAMLSLVVSTSTLAAQQGGGPASDSARVAAEKAHTVQPERPTVATHAYTVAPGYVEIEAGVQDARPAGATQFGAPVVAKLGLASRTQLEFQGGYTRSTVPSAATSGVMDLAVALKQRVLDAAPLLHDFSVQGALKLPTGARGVGTGTTDVSLLLISSRPIGAAELDLNAGYTRRSGDGRTAPTSATLVTASFGTPLRGPVGGVAELFAYPGTGGPVGQHPALGVLIGPTLQLHPWLVLDAGAILDVQGLGANAAYAGLTYNVGRIPGWPLPRGGGPAR